MKLAAGAIDRAVADGPPRSWLLAGEEPLLVMEARLAIIAELTQAGYDERQVLEVERGFDWSRLAAEGAAQSLFAGRRIIDLRIPNGKPGKEGSAALREFAESAGADVSLIVSFGKWEKAHFRSAWYKALDKQGAVIELAPVRARQLPSWLQQRAEQMGLRLSRDAVMALTRRTEGNLLASAQELDKLKLLYGESSIDVEQIEAASGDSARYDVFGLVDAMVGGRVDRAIRVLHSLQAEGEPEVRIVWALHRELRHLLAIAELPPRTHAEYFQRQRIWPQRQRALQQAVARRPRSDWAMLLQFATLVDAAAKGQRQLGRVGNLLELLVADAASEGPLQLAQWPRVAVA